MVWYVDLWMANRWQIACLRAKHETKEDSYSYDAHNTCTHSTIATRYIQHSIYFGENGRQKHSPFQYRLVRYTRSNTKHCRDQHHRERPGIVDTDSQTMHRPQQWAIAPDKLLSNAVTWPFNVRTKTLRLYFMLPFNSSLLNRLTFDTIWTRDVHLKQAKEYSGDMCVSVCACEPITSRSVSSSSCDGGGGGGVK